MNFYSKDPAIITGKDTYTPSAMEICTPYVNRGNNQISRKRSISGICFVDFSKFLFSYFDGLLCEIFIFLLTHIYLF